MAFCIQIGDICGDDISGDGISLHDVPGANIPGDDVLPHTQEPDDAHELYGLYTSEQAQYEIEWALSPQEL